MFFNLLLKTCETEVQIQSLSSLMKQCLTEPKRPIICLGKIEMLDKYVSAIFNKAPTGDKCIKHQIQDLSVISYHTFGNIQLSTLADNVQFNYCIIYRYWTMERTKII